MSNAPAAGQFLHDVAELKINLYRGDVTVRIAIAGLNRVKKVKGVKQWEDFIPGDVQDKVRKLCNALFEEIFKLRLH